MTAATTTTNTAASNRAGIALPLMLFVFVIVAILGAGAMTVVGREHRVAGQSSMQVEAYALARSGLERFLADREALGFKSDPPAPAESIRVALQGGYADVVLEEIRPEQSLTVPGLYVVRSRGVATDGSAQSRPIGERTVAMIARWQQPSMQVLAAWTSLFGVAADGSAGGGINGFDACGASGSVAGVAVPTSPGYTQASGPPLPSGSPGILTLGTTAQGAQTVTVDWASLAEGNTGTEVVRFPGSLWPSGAEWADAEYWPMIFAAGDFTLPGDGRGTLIVTGNLRVSGARSWDGIVLVGGMLLATAPTTVNGAMVTGLNAKSGTSNAPPDSTQAYTRVQYNSCNVSRALAAYRGLTPFRNAVIDNWPTY